MSNFNNYISLKSITVSYEKFGSRVVALNNISLNISEGEWVYVSGPNGSGKTTLLKSISKQINIDSGIINFKDRPVTALNLKELSHTFFYVNQNPLQGSVSQLTVSENLIAAIPNYRLKNLERSLLSRLLDEAGLYQHRNHVVEYLSGGQRQILTLLIARFRNPEILLLDEPLSSLDPSNTAIAYSIIRNIHNEGKTVLYVTHEQNVINDYKGRIIRLDKGNLVESHQSI